MAAFDSENIAVWIEKARAGDEQALSELVAAAMEYLFPAVLAMLRDQSRKGGYLTDALSEGGPDLPERMQDDAWAITHAACCRMALKLDAFRGRNAFGREVQFTTWLYAIARNEMRNTLRSRFREAKRRWRRRSRGGEQGADDGAPGEALDRAVNGTLHGGSGALYGLDGASWLASPEQVVEEHAERRLVLEALAEAPLTPEQREAVLLYYGLGLKQERIAQITGVQVGTVKKRLFDGLGKLRAYVKDRSGEPANRDRRA